MSLKLYNSLSRKKETFVPLVEGQVGIYVCGPTVYGPPHLGHAKSYISFDVLVKYLRESGLKVRYVQNITDVGHLTDDADSGEDKIERQARIDKVHPWEVVDKWTRQYMGDMEKLNVEHPSFYVRASQHIPEQIEAIEKLIEKGFAYEVDGNVYFEVTKFPEYGKLSGRILDEQQDAVRVESRKEKRNPRDFALWKKADVAHILKWNSPWGIGFPGWHIECSVMANKYLGETIDIHAGGMENKFPHHECEIAQSEALNDKPFSRYWLHNNMITVDGVKMGKSLGNFVTCEDLLKEHSPESVRYFILSTHYRSPSNYTHDAIEAASVGLVRLTNLQAHLNEIAKSLTDDPKLYENVKQFINDYNNKMLEHMNDDLDTPGAIAALYSMTTEANKFINEKKIDSKGAKEVLAFMHKWGREILGIIKPNELPQSALDIEPVINAVIEFRAEMKQQKKYDVADYIRDKMKTAGILIEDTKDGSRWRKA